MHHTVSLTCYSRCCNAVLEAFVMDKPAIATDYRIAGHDEPLLDEQRQVPRRVGFVWHDHQIGAEYWP